MIAKDGESKANADRVGELEAALQEANAIATESVKELERTKQNEATSTGADEDAAATAATAAAAMVREEMEAKLKAMKAEHEEAMKGMLATEEVLMAKAGKHEAAIAAKEP